MFKNAILSTWKMSETGANKGFDILKDGGSLKKALLSAISDVEDNPSFESVGYGGLPNHDGEVELDAAYMDGKDLSVGAVMSLKGFKNPFKIAMTLNGHHLNNVLAGEGAAQYALEIGEKPVELLTQSTREKWKIKRQEFNDLKAYSGHDTVCVIVSNDKGEMAVGVSTSGLFMKKPGRVGDSPLIGSGFYVDSDVGGVAATGVGEEIMKGCLSYEIISLMRDGYTAQEACERAVLSLHKRLKRHKDKVGDISAVALNNKGDMGAATNLDKFFFVYRSDETDTIVKKGMNVLKK